MADTFTIERKTTIAAPPADVFAKISSLREWDTWSPWAEMDPSMNKTYTGEDGAVGSSYSWNGNRKVGEGSMTITEVDSPSKVEIDLEFLKPFKSKNVTTMRVAPSGDGSDVTWTMVGPMTLMTKIMGIFKSMDKMVGPDFEKGLAKLKRITEAG